MLLGAELDAYRRAEWTLECVSLTVVASDGSVKYRGGGAISHAGNGGFSVSLYDPANPPGVPDDFLATVSPGTLIKGEDLPHLEAVDVRGRVWKSDGILLDWQKVVGQQGIVVTGVFGSLTSFDELPRPGQTGLWMFIPTDAEVPANEVTKSETDAGGLISRSFRRDLWLFKDRGREFRIGRRTEGLEVAFTAPAGQDLARLDTRIEEALWFTLGRLVACTLLVRRQGTQEEVLLRRRVFESAKPRMSPPLGIQPGIPGTHHEIFLRYLDHITTHVEPSYHPTSVAVQRVLASSAMSLEDEALALSVSIESLVSRYFSQLGVPSRPVVAAVEGIIKHLGEWTGDLRDRAIGVVRRLSQPNSRSALKALCGRSPFTSLQYEAWEKVRNKLAHGQPSESIAELLPLVTQLRQLFLFIVLTLIGYEGPYTDYCALNWPTKAFPSSRQDQLCPTGVTVGRTS